MDQLSLTISVLVTAFLILYFTFSWDKNEHYLLRILGSFFFIALLLIVPKIGIDYKQECDFAVNQSTTNFVTNTTTYTYDYICSDKTNNTTVIFHKVILRFLIVFSSYVFVYLLYVWLLKGNVKLENYLKRFKK